MSIIIKTSISLRLSREDSFSSKPLEQQSIETQVKAIIEQIKAAELIQDVFDRREELQNLAQQLYTFLKPLPDNYTKPSQAELQELKIKIAEQSSVTRENAAKIVGDLLAININPVQLNSYNYYFLSSLINCNM
jgi:hypothetical protein